MPAFTIDEVLSEDHFHMDAKGDFPGGDFVTYEIMFSGDQGKGTGITKRKEGSPAPEPGESFDGELIHKNGKVELKKVYKPAANGSRSSSKSSDFRTPEQIMRSDAHGKAMHWCDIKVAAGEWQPLTWEQYILMVDRYYEDLKAAS